MAFLRKFSDACHIELANIKEQTPSKLTRLSLG
jgi:hypothetical protein